MKPEIDIEELNEAIENYCPEAHAAYEKEFFIILEAAQAYAELLSKTQWQTINHEKILHPFEIDILCSDGEHDVFSCYQSVNGWFLTQSGKKIAPPKYWMPLPPARIASEMEGV